MKKYEVIENFLLLAGIPRKSHHEEKVSQFLYDWALQKGLKAERDPLGNVIIDKPASPGCEKAPLTILQGHMDMVTVWEEGKKFDPLNDPIAVVDDGETLHALGTSLGGDDGIGVAMAMTVLEEKDAVHGPIRAIFTVDEEDGMTGADGLDARYVKDASYLVNLDWEVYGSLCCSSAGSDQYTLSRTPVWEESDEKDMAVRVTVSGLTGGHSGTSIHYGRANAIRSLAGILQAVIRFGIPLRLASFRGGSAHNAIPSSAEAEVVVRASDLAFFMAVGESDAMSRRGLWMGTDPNGVYSIDMLKECPKRCISEKDTSAWMDLMSTVHDGVKTMSKTIPGLVESSANLGVAALTEDAMTFGIHQRSSEPSLTDSMLAEYRVQAAEAEFELHVDSSSPAWPVRPGSELVDICCRCYREQHGSEMKVEPIHAGLECGAFSDKNPAMDIISIGPELRDIHSPRETLVLQTAYDCDELVHRILKEISKK